VVITTLPPAAYQTMRASGVVAGKRVSVPFVSSTDRPRAGNPKTEASLILARFLIRAGEVERLLCRAAGETLMGRGNPGALAILGPHYSTLDVSLHDFALAKSSAWLLRCNQGGHGGPAVRPPVPGDVNRRARSCGRISILFTAKAWSRTINFATLRIRRLRSKAWDLLHRPREPK